MMRKKSVKVKQRNEPVLAMIKDIKACHPFWGYRRCWAYLYYREGIKVNKKRIYRLMKENSLLVNKRRYKAKRKPSVCCAFHRFGCSRPTCSESCGVKQLTMWSRSVMNVPCSVAWRSSSRREIGQYELPKI